MCKDEKAKGCYYCEGKTRMAFSSNVRCLRDNDFTEDVPVPIRYCPACGRELPKYWTMNGEDLKG